SEIGCHRDRFLKHPIINDYVLEAIGKQKEKRIIDFEGKILEAIDRLVSSNQLISNRSVSRILNVDVHRILEKKRFKEIVSKAIVDQEKRKENIIIRNVEKLLSECKNVTFLELHRQTRLPRSYIESNRIRKLIKEIM
ncbi:MAG: hypothetical protein OEY49_10025, partial [Candidatus Heimdallarchaeota archaeon]|nr:hypothetical protein [Candidatus Heimdallarchaeota archaeon]